MLYIIDFLFALVVAVLLSLVLIALMGPQRRREGSSVAGAVMFFFIILFFASWAGGVWLAPVGAPVWGGTWAPFLLVGVFVALLLAAAGEHSRHMQERRETESPEADIATNAMAFGMFFWVLIIALVAAVIAGYFPRA